jgi:hypothetical protein
MGGVGSGIHEEKEVDRRDEPGDDELMSKHRC